MPQLPMRSHVVIGKAGGAAVQEAIAAKCPMIINQVIPGQEKGNADIIRDANIGVVVDGRKEVARWVERLAEDGGEQWSQWRRQMEKISRPQVAMQIAKLILVECGVANKVARPEKFPVLTTSNNGLVRADPAAAKMVSLAMRAQLARHH